MTALEEIKKILPEDAVVSNTGTIDKYSTDETSLFAAAPDAVVLPVTTAQVSAVMKICSQYEIPVTARGAGTGVTAGSLAVNGGIVLSLERMNKIKQLDIKNLTMTVEPGVKTVEIHNEAGRHGLFYPPDPASLENCSIGGNLAESAGGPRAVKYGTTKDYILGIEFVTANGDIMRAGGKYVKNSAGYNIAQLITGSEGTLAIVTEIILKLIPAPGFAADFLIPFNSLDEAIDAVAKILQKRIIPAAIEFMEKSAIEITAKHSGKEIIFPDASAQLLIQLDGESKKDVIEKAEALCAALHIKYGSIAHAFNEEDRARVWAARRSIRSSIAAISPVFFAEDPAVPRAEIPSFIKEVKRNLDSLSLQSVFFGHAGDGNVHLNILKGDCTDERWEKIKPEVKKMIYETAVKNGGTITGEHGVGYLRKDYMKLMYSDEEIELMRSIKKAFDPKGILNPGKIF